MFVRLSLLSSLLLAFGLTVLGCKSKPKPKPRSTHATKTTKRSTSRPVVRRRQVRPPPRPEKRVARPKPKPRPVDMRKYLRDPPKGFVDLKKFIPGIRLSIRYHTPRNFTEAPLPGYGAPGAWMLKRAAKALKQVQKDAEKRGLGLLVYDAYRPIRGTLGMAAWATRTEQMHLFKNGYIARYSGHNHGHTVDLTIVDLKTGKPLDMGTPWDTLNTKSHTRNAKGKHLRNRLLLRKLMRRRGFRPYYKEWWHFGFRMRGTKRRDVPYGCFESDEGEWKAPRGWDKPGYKMPMKWQPEPCD